MSEITENNPVENGVSQNDTPQNEVSQVETPQVEVSQSNPPQSNPPQKESMPFSVKILCVVIAIFAINIVLLIGLLVITNNKKKNDSTASNSQVTASSAESTPASSESSDANKQESAPASEQDSSAAASEELPASEPVELTEGDVILVYSTGNSWENGSTKMNSLEIKVTNQSETISNGWKLVIAINDLVEVQGWDGTYTINGDNLEITNTEHNGTINEGASIYVGCNIGTASDLTLTKATLNGLECTIQKGNVDRNKELDEKNKNGNSGEKNTTPVASLERPKEAKQGDDWLHTDGRKILDQDGKEVWLTGCNWFGYNTGTNTFDGLWNSQLAPTVKGIADHGFNLIRIPISAELINQWAAGEYPKANYNNAYNEELNSMNSLEIFDYFLVLAETNGIKVMPDIHSAETNASGHNVNLWCTDKVKVEDYYKALEWMADRYKDNDTIIAFDLKNEPHGKPNEGKNAAIWNDSKDANNWKYVAETAAARILAKNPNVLILVEGTEIYPMKKGGDYSSTNEKDYYFNWWGGNLRGVAEYPVNLGKYQNKLVYSPHDYGPTVYKQPWFEGSYNYDSLMKDCWKDNWFYIYEENIAPLLIGEWGGFMTEPNLTWMTHMRKLISTYHLNHTFWCINANSGDTGGLLLDDFTTWDTEKYNFVKEVLWQQNGKFVGLDHAIPLGKDGITLKDAKSDHK